MRKSLSAELRHGKLSYIPMFSDRQKSNESSINFSPFSRILPGGLVNQIEVRTNQTAFQWHVTPNDTLNNFKCNLKIRETSPKNLIKL